MKESGKTVTKYKFYIADDGANARESNFEVSWQDERVTVIVRGSEQGAVQYDLFFDGTVETEGGLEETEGVTLSWKK